MQWQCGSVNDNLNVQEFMKNTQVIRVIKEVCNSQKRGNCRGGTEEPCINDTLSACEPLPKWMHHSNKSIDTFKLYECNVFSCHLQSHITFSNLWAMVIKFSTAM